MRWVWTQRGGRAWLGPLARSLQLLAALVQLDGLRGDLEAEQVLAAIGTEHPDKLIAKTARIALFKYRSSG